MNTTFSKSVILSKPDRQRYISAKSAGVYFLELTFVKGPSLSIKSLPKGMCLIMLRPLVVAHIFTFPYSNLAVVLGDIDPYLFQDHMPADPAAWSDFCEYYKEAEDSYGSELEVGYYTAIRFLRVYEEEWDFPIPYAMEEFTTEKYREYYFNQNP